MGGPGWEMSSKGSDNEECMEPEPTIRGRQLTKKPQLFVASISRPSLSFALQSRRKETCVVGTVLQSVEGLLAATILFRVGSAMTRKHFRISLDAHLELDYGVLWDCPKNGPVRETSLVEKSEGGRHMY